MRRVLFDENFPRKLRRDLPEFVIRTVQEEGWSGFENGDLLGRAALDFDVFVTADQNLRYQQNVTRFDIGVVAVETFDTTVDNLRRVLPQLRAAIETVAMGTILIVKVD